jgi:hypothetical protein
MKCFLRDWIYVDNMDTKFQVQKIHQKNDIFKKIDIVTKKYSPKNSEIVPFNDTCW